MHSCSASVVTANFPAHRKARQYGEKSTEQKVGSARSRVCTSLKLARKNSRPPKQTSANPLSTSQNPHKSAAGLLIRAALTPSMQHFLGWCYFVAFSA